MSIETAFDPHSRAVIDPAKTHIRRPFTLSACIVNFSYHIMDALKQAGIIELKEKEAVRFVSCALDLYTVRGTDIGVIQTQVGAPFTVSLIEDAAFSFGCRKFILFGSCGALDKGLTAGRIIVPTYAYRDEGVSYHYAPAADYIRMRNADFVFDTLSALHIPCVQGRTWTCDAFFRETEGNMQKRKAEGCIAVEMEVAGVQAVCDFYGLELYDFLEAGDVLEASGYQVEGLTKANHDLGKLYVALETALRI